MKEKAFVGFSLVETAIALAVMSVAIIAVISLLPIGVQSNKVSAEESVAMNTLTAMEADLRNSYPQTSGRSPMFKLPLPYGLLSGRVILNDSLSKLLPTTTLAAAYSSGCTTALDESLAPVVMAGANSHPRFQASVIYTHVPAAGSVVPIEARIIVNWPAIANGTVADLTDPRKVEGYVQAYITFEAP